MRLDEALALDKVRIVAKSSRDLKVHIQAVGRATPLCGWSWWRAGGALELRSRADFNANGCGVCARSFLAEFSAEPVPA